MLLYPQFLEEDIDADDPVLAEPGELDGEELLATLALSSGGSVCYTAWHGGGPAMCAIRYMP